MLGTVPPAEVISTGKRSMDDGASGSGTAVTELEAMMDELGLKEEDLQDVIVEDDEIPAEATRWMAIVRVHTKKEVLVLQEHESRMGSGEGSEDTATRRKPVYPAVCLSR